MTTWPVGTEQERAQATDRLPGDWYNANPFLNKYKIGGRGNDTRHTGVDLNLPRNADFHSPIYAVEDGTVTCARNLGGSWGNVVAIEHSGFYSRSGHVERMQVREGDSVREGTIIAYVSDGSNYYSDDAAHLHFDISISSILKSSPAHWPGLDMPAILRNYVDPVLFLIARMKDNVVVETETDVTAKLYKIVNPAGDNIRLRYSYMAPLPRFVALPPGTTVEGYDMIRNGFRLCGHNEHIGWISEEYLVPA